MSKNKMDLDISKQSDQWVTDRYCKELLKAKAAVHFQGKMNLGQADIAVMTACK